MRQALLDRLYRRAENASMADWLRLCVSNPEWSRGQRTEALAACTRQTLELWGRSCTALAVGSAHPSHQVPTPSDAWSDPSQQEGSHA